MDLYGAVGVRHASPLLVLCLVSNQPSAPAMEMSLSRLNHRLPRGQTDPEVMQGTADFHHEIADAVLPQPDPVFHDTTTLDAAVDMLDPQPTVMQGPVGQVLFPGEFLATRFLGRHQDLHLRERERQE